MKYTKYERTNLINQLQKIEEDAFKRYKDIEKGVVDAINSLLDPDLEDDKH